MVLALLELEIVGIVNRLVWSRDKSISISAITYGECIGCMRHQHILVNICMSQHDYQHDIVHLVHNCTDLGIVRCCTPNGRGIRHSICIQVVRKQSMDCHGIRPSNNNARDDWIPIDRLHWIRNELVDTVQYSCDSRTLDMMGNRCRRDNQLRKEAKRITRLEMPSKKFGSAFALTYPRSRNNVHFR